MRFAFFSMTCGLWLACGPWLTGAQAEVWLLEGEAGAPAVAQVSGVAIGTAVSKSVMLGPPSPGHVLSGLAFLDRDGVPCHFEVTHRRLSDETAVAQSAPQTVADCGQAQPNGAEGSRKALSAPPGFGITGVSVCLERDGVTFAGVAMALRPDFCVADPGLWIETETGAPFRLRVRQADGTLLRPPWSYARSCRSSVAERTFSDARPTCKAWQDWSRCPEGALATGVHVVMSETPPETTPTRITGLALRCQRVVTTH